MPLFGSSSTFDADVDKATSELNTSENWNLILDICDRAKQSTPAAKDCLRSIQRRLNNKIPVVAIQALSLLNACVKNCVRIFHLEIASRDFIDECKNLLSDKSHPKVAQTLRLYIKAWAEGEFKSDSTLSLIPDFYNSLKAEGHSFVSDEPPKSSVVLSKDPNVVNSQEEQDDIAKAIALSLKDVEKQPKTMKTTQQTTNSSLYPGFSSSANTTSMSLRPREPTKVRALYDFEAAEDNELTFKAGEIIGVIDDSDPNWWKGVSWRGEGLFPANFVTQDLEGAETKETNEKVTNEVIDPAPEPAPQAVIDEDKIDRTLILIQNADPTGESCPDPQDLALLEDQCRCMVPLINQELEKIDRQHMRLMEVNRELLTALQMYHGLMTEQPSYSGYMAPQDLGRATSHMYAPYSGVQGSVQGGPPSYMTANQLLTMQQQQQSLSIGQIPQGISAQVGPVTTLPQGVNTPHTQPELVHQSMMTSVQQQQQQYVDPSLQYSQPHGSMAGVQYTSVPGGYVAYSSQANIP